MERPRPPTRGLLRAAELLSIPGLAAGAGAALVWAGWFVSRMGLHLAGGADVVLLVPAFAAGWGRSSRLKFVTLGILGIGLAWTALPLLL
jgi:hypothetical protein